MAIERGISHAMINFGNYDKYTEQNYDLIKSIIL
jgi:hypothetical protein